jgi:hypothetical protein
LKPFEEKGETMTARPSEYAKPPNSGRSEGMQDVLLVSSFGLWAALLGLAPVLAFRLLMGN